MGVIHQAPILKSRSWVQVSTINALMLGFYYGITSLDELTEFGNFGIDTCNSLDGEMILLNDTFYQVKSDGKIYYPASDTRTPFATVTSFAPETTTIAGTFCGFFCPAYVTGINVPGYHLHFLSDDRTSGGHLLDFESMEGVLELDQVNIFIMILPTEAGFLESELHKDLHDELKKVEGE